MFCSLLPGTFVFGSTPDAVADAVCRLKGKPRGPSLAGSPAYREASAERRRPDLFLYLDAPALTRWAEDAVERELLDRKAEVRKENKARQDQEPTADARKARAAQLPRELEEAARQHRQDNAAWYAFRTLANPAGLRFLSSSITLHRTDFTWRIDARVRPGQASPLLDLLADRPVTADLLRGLPRDSFFLVALPLVPGTTWSQILRAADTAHAAAGLEGPAPGNLVRDFEKQTKVRLGREVFARVKAVAWGVRLGEPEKGDLEPGPGVLVLEGTDADAARGLEEVLPRLLAGGPRPAEPRAFRGGGGTVWSLTGDEEKVPGGPPAFYGRRGPTLVLGWQRDDVAAALRDAGEPVDLSDHPRALAALQAAGPAGGAALLSGRQVLAALTRILSKKPDQKAKDLRILHYLREVSAPMAVMPPTLGTLRRRPDGLHFEMTQPELRVAAATVIDIFVATILDEHVHKE
jgi:hypothetical protein